MRRCTKDGIKGLRQTAHQQCTGFHTKIVRTSMVSKLICLTCGDAA